MEGNISFKEKYFIGMMQIGITKVRKSQQDRVVEASSDQRKEIEFELLRGLNAHVYEINICLYMFRQFI